MTNRFKLRVFAGVCVEIKGIREIVRKPPATRVANRAPRARIPFHPCIAAVPAS